MIASGVRSSCDASATKRRCDANATSSRSSIESNVSASRFSSSSGPSSSIRRESSRAWISRATLVMRAIGASTRPATTQPTPRLATKRTPSAPNEKLRRLRSVRSFTSRSNAFASTYAPLLGLAAVVDRHLLDDHGLRDRLVAEAQREAEVEARDEDRGDAEEDAGVEQRQPDADRAEERAHASSRSR